MFCNSFADRVCYQSTHRQPQPRLQRHGGDCNDASGWMAQIFGRTSTSIEIAVWVLSTSYQIDQFNSDDKEPIH